jgi:hypothetical protein
MIEFIGCNSHTVTARINGMVHHVSWAEFARLDDAASEPH